MRCPITRLWSGTSPAEEAVIDHANAWMGSTTGIKQNTWVLVLWLVWNIFAPPAWRFDPYPFIFLMAVLTILSYLTNLFLMNKAIRVAEESARLTRQQELRQEHDAQMLAMMEQILQHVAQQADVIQDEVEELVAHTHPEGGA